MPTERIAMRRVREMLKLKLEGGLSTQEVARRTGAALIGPPPGRVRGP